MIPRRHCLFVLRALLIAPVFSILCSGCSSQLLLSDALVDRLSGQGPVAVSADNPYSAANLWLAKESERSQEVRGFLQMKGNPSEVEIHHDFMSAPRATLYYRDPRGRLSYELEPIASTWLIKGPHVIQTDIAREVATQSDEESPRAASPTKIDPLSVRAQHSPPKGGAFVSPAIDKRMAHVSFTALAKRAPAESLTDLISRTAEGSAEVSPKGDVVHYITLPGEQLSVIARWYTLDGTNAGRLARINQLTSPDHLEIGDQVVIPSYMVKNKARLSEQALQELLKQ